MSRKQLPRFSRYVSSRLRNPRVNYDRVLERVLAHGTRRIDNTRRRLHAQNVSSQVSGSRFMVFRMYVYMCVCVRSLSFQSFSHSRPFLLLIIFLSFPALRSSDVFPLYSTKSSVILSEIRRSTTESFANRSEWMREVRSSRGPRISSKAQPAITPIDQSIDRSVLSARFFFPVANTPQSQLYAYIRL